MVVLVLRWFFLERTLEDFLGMSEDDIGKLFINEYGYHLGPPSPSFSTVKLLLKELYNENKLDFFKKCSEYQNLLVEGGVLGNLTYNELLELSKDGKLNLQIWTESPVLHQRIRY